MDDLPINEGELERTYFAWRNEPFPHGSSSDAVDELHAELAYIDVLVADYAIPSRQRESSSACWSLTGHQLGRGWLRFFKKGDAAQPTEPEKAMESQWTPLDPARVEAIKGAAANALKGLNNISPVPVGYDRDGVEFADGYISRLREAGFFKDESTHGGFITVFGAYLGECFIRRDRGDWVEGDRIVGVRLDPSSVVFPFAKVQKFLTDESDSIASFFDMVAQMRAFHADPEAHNVRIVRLSDLNEDGGPADTEVKSEHGSP